MVNKESKHHRATIRQTEAQYLANITPQLALATSRSTLSPRRRYRHSSGDFASSGYPLENSNGPYYLPMCRTTSKTRPKPAATCRSSTECTSSRADAFVNGSSSFHNMLDIGVSMEKWTSWLTYS